MRKLLLMSLGLVLLFSSCNRDKFGYESEWLSPLFNTSLGLADFQLDSFLTENPDGTVDLVFDYEETIDSLLDVLEVPDSLEEVSVSLTQLVLEDRNFVDTITLLDLYPQSILFHNQTTILPAQDISSDQGTILDVTEEFFTTATFKEGFLDMKIYNDLPVEVELIEFELLNNEDQSVVVSGQFNNIQPGGVDSQSFDLAGKTVKGILEAKIKRVKTKTSPGPVLIDVFKGLRVELSVRDLKPESATAIFPAQNLIENKAETVYNFKGPEITTMRVRSGNVVMTVYSTIEEEIILDYRIPYGIHYQTGDTLDAVFRIPPAKNGVPSEVSATFPIDGYEILYKGEDPSQPPFVNAFYNELIAKIEYTGIERTLSLSDSVYIQFGLKDIVPEWAIGGFGFRQFVYNDPQSLGAFADLYGKINLEDATLNLDFENTFGIEAELKINSIEGYNSRTDNRVQLQSAAFAQPLLIERGKNITTRVSPYNLLVGLDKSNSNLKLFLENLPDQINPSFEIRTQPNGNNNYTDFVFHDSYLKSRMSLHVPLRIGLEDLRLERTTPFSLNNEDLTGVKRGVLKLKANNEFPWSAFVQMEFLDENDNLITTVSSPNPMLAAEVDPLTDRTVGDKESILEFALSAEKIQLIRSATKVRISSTFNTENAQRYPIFSDYNMHFKLIADFVYEN